MSIKQGSNIIAGRTQAGSSHFLGEWVLATLEDGVLPQGCIRPDGYEQLNASNSMFADLWNEALLPSRDWAKPVILPYFQSNFQSGYIITDSQNNTKAYQILNGTASFNTNTTWDKYFLTIKMSDKNCLENYYIKVPDKTKDYPTSWRIQGSMNDTTWEDIETVKGQSFKLGESKYFTLNNNKEYNYYKISFISGVSSGANALIDRIDLRPNKFGTYLNICSFDEYYKEIRETGVCTKWAVDYARNKFKIPFVPEDGMDWKDFITEIGDVPVKGNGMTLGLTDGQHNNGYIREGVYGQVGFAAYEDRYGTPVGSPRVGTSNLNYQKTVGITTDGSKSGMVADLSNVKIDSKFKARVKWFLYVASGEIGDFLINWNKLQDSLNIGNGIEIGDINFSLGLIDETKNLRRKLNGQVMSLDLFTAFGEKMRKLRDQSPEKFVTESEWQKELSESPSKTCGKFVLDDANNTIRLAKYPEYLNKDYTKAPVKGNGISLGLTNGVNNFGINNTYQAAYSISSIDGVYGKPIGTNPSAPAPNRSESIGITPDPAKSGMEADLVNATYEAIPITYYIQVATGYTEREEVVNTYQLNNPYSLFDMKWSDHKLENISWLLSKGQWNSGTLYKKAYDELVKLHATPVEGGISIKLDSEQFTDYDFVLKTSEQTFRLPLKTKLVGGGRASVSSGEPHEFVSDISGKDVTFAVNSKAPYGGKTPYTLGCNNEHMCLYNGASGNGTAQNSIKFDNLCSDLSKATNENLFLYFYVGETVENANLIDAGRFADALANKVDDTGDVDLVIDYKVNSDASWYRKYKSGWVEQGGRVYAKQNATITVPLVYPLANNIYQVFTMPEHDARDIWGYGQTIPSKTTTDFKLYIHNSAGSYNTAWYACGQGV